jgi:hypothetical protein
MTRRKLIRLAWINGFVALLLAALAGWYAVDGNVLAIVWTVGAACFAVSVVFNVLTLRHVED